MMKKTSSIVSVANSARQILLQMSPTIAIFLTMRFDPDEGRDKADSGARNGESGQG